MSEADLLLKSLGLLLIGMGIVFGFLLLLVGAVRLMSRFALRLAPAEPLPGRAPQRTPEPASDELVAVIAAAISRHRGAR